MLFKHLRTVNYAPVIPAKAGIHNMTTQEQWIPTFVRMTENAHK